MKKCLLSLLSLIVMVGMVHADEEVSNATFLEMATNAANYIGSHSNKIPSIISDNSGTIKVNTADFYYMMARWLRYYLNYSAAPVTVGITRYIGVPDDPSYPGSNYSPNRDQILYAGNNTANWIDQNGRVPSYTTINYSYNVDASDLFYIFARAIRWYAEHGSLPAQGASYYQTIPPDTWTSSVDIPTEAKPLAEEGKVLLFPNPVENVLNIQLPSEVSSGIIQIISLNGSIVHSETICCKQDAFQVEVSGLPKGLYICKISTEAGIKTVKFNKL